MRYAIALNLAIVSCVLAALFFLQQPLALLGLLMLQDMPYGLLQQEPQRQEEGTPAGFLHDRLDRPNQHSERSPAQDAVMVPSFGFTNTRQDRHSERS